MPRLFVGVVSLVFCSGLAQAAPDAKEAQATIPEQKALSKIRATPQLALRALMGGGEAKVSVKGAMGIAVIPKGSGLKVYQTFSSSEAEGKLTIRELTFLPPDARHSRSLISTEQKTKNGVRVRVARTYEDMGRGLEWRHTNVTYQGKSSCRTIHYRKGFKGPQRGRYPRLRH